MPRPMLAGVFVESPPQSGTEVTVSKDKGCEVSPSCLACPLPECKYDVPLYSQLSRYWRATTVIEAMETGEPLFLVANKQFGMSLKSRSRDFNFDYSHIGTYGNHPFLAKLWNAGYRPKYQKGKPTIERVAV